MTGHRAAGDEELLERLRSGDTRALDELLQRYWSPIVAYVKRLTGSTDAAEDVAQRTFSRVWERRATWKTSGSVRGLLYRVARNFAVTEHRSAEARSRAGRVLATAAPSPATPLQLVEEGELRVALERAIAALPPRRREVFILRCVHELSYKEIAGVMHISPQTVANQLSHALAALRESLHGLLDD